MTSRRNLWVLLLSGAFLFAPLRTLHAAPPVAKADTENSASTLVAVVVRIPVPSGSDRPQIEAAMAKTVPFYQSLPGLVRKYFTISDDRTFGGIYLWRSRQAAENWYNEEWRARVTKTYGGAPQLDYFDVPIAIEGLGTQPVAGSDPVSGKVAVLVRVPDPPGWDRSQIEAAMAKTVPTYQKVPGLIRKYFILSDDQKLGGIYLWDSRKTAEAWYSDSIIWHGGVSKLSGFRAEITYFDVPIVADGLKPQD